jgi:hypothetical protein
MSISWSRNGVFGHQAFQFDQWMQGAVDPDDRVVADLEVQIRSIPFHAYFQQIINTHG